MHDTSSAAYLALRLVHILGAMAMTGALVTALVAKLSADRAGDPSRAAGLHGALRRVDSSVVGPSALATFAGGYAMIRFLGGRIGEHWFSIFGLILLTVAVAAWYFGIRNLNVALTEEAEASVTNKQPLGIEYGKRSAAWVLWTVVSLLALVAAAFVMVFRDQLGIG